MARRSDPVNAIRRAPYHFGRSLATSTLSQKGAIGRRMGRRAAVKAIGQNMWRLFG